jgi:hypothetical protein
MIVAAHLTKLLTWATTTSLIAAAISAIVAWWAWIAFRQQAQHLEEEADDGPARGHSPIHGKLKTDRDTSDVDDKASPRKTKAIRGKADASVRTYVRALDVMSYATSSWQSTFRLVILLLALSIPALVIVLIFR